MTGLQCFVEQINISSLKWSYGFSHRFVVGSSHHREFSATPRDTSLLLLRTVLEHHFIIAVCILVGETTTVISLTESWFCKIKIRISFLWLILVFTYIQTVYRSVSQIDKKEYIQIYICTYVYWYTHILIYRAYIRLQTVPHTVTFRKIFNFWSFISNFLSLFYWNK